jgi:hypothetical protein
MDLGKSLVNELGSYLDNETANRALTISDTNGDEWDIDSAAFKGGELYVVLRRGDEIHGITIKLTVVADQRFR